jgi:hypothetical protein
MEAYRSVSVVARLAILACITLIACNGSSDKPAEQASETTGTAGVTAADTSGAKVIAIEDAHLDSLRLRYEQGDVYRYRVTQLSEGGSDSVVATTKTKHVYTKRIKAIRSDGSYEVGMRFDSIQVKATVRSRQTGKVLEEQEYRSSDTAMRKDVKYISFNALLGEEITILTNTRGQIQEMSGVSSVVNRILAASPNVPKEYAAELSKQIEMSVYATFTEQEYLRFPTTKLDSTNSWVTSTSAPVMNLFMASNTVKYHVAAVKMVKDRKLADIEATMNGTITLQKLPADAPMKVSLSKSVVKGSGRAIIDVAKGFTVFKQNDVYTIVAANVRIVATGEQRNVSQETTMRYSVELLR